MKKLKRYKYEHYAILCQLAYRADTVHRIDLSNFQQIELVDATKKSCLRVVWQEHKREVVVVFRGSHSIRDWVLNLCLFQCNVFFGAEKYRVHWGITQLLDQYCRKLGERKKVRLKDMLLAILEPLVIEGKKITFVGHSTGGAMAVLFADQFERKFPKKTKRVVTFGQPSLGGRSFAKQYKLAHKTYRVCCDIDLVTFLPPLPFVYVHVGKMLWLHEGEIYENIPSWKRLLLSLKSWFLGPISNHFMYKYIRHKGLFDEH